MYRFTKYINFLIDKKVIPLDYKLKKKFFEKLNPNASIDYIYTNNNEELIRIIKDCIHILEERKDIFHNIDQEFDKCLEILKNLLKSIDLEKINIENLYNNELSKELVKIITTKFSVKKLKAVQEFIKNDPSGINNTYFGSTMLMLSVEYPKSEELTKFLLSREDCDINIRDDFGESAIFKLFSRGHEPSMDIVKLFLERKDIRINLIDRFGRPVLFSVLNYDDSFVKLFLERKDIDINLQDEQGNTALMYFYDHSTRFTENLIKNAKLLLNYKGIRVNLRNNEGKNALQLACQNLDERHEKKYLPFIQVLLDYGIEIDPNYDYGIYDDLIKKKYIEDKRKEVQKLFYLAKKDKSVLGKLPKEIFGEVLDFAYPIKF